MDREFLASLDIEGSLADSIMHAHTAALDELTEKTALLEEQLSAFSDAENWKERYENEVRERELQQQKQDALEADRLILEALRRDGVNPRAAGLLAGAIDRGAVTVKDGAISNWQDISQDLREKYSDFFGDVVTVGAEVGTPPQFNIRTDDPFVSGFDA